MIDSWVLCSILVLFFHLPQILEEGKHDWVCQLTIATSRLVIGLPRRPVTRLIFRLAFSTPLMYSEKASTRNDNVFYAYSM